MSLTVAEQRTFEQRLVRDRSQVEVQASRLGLVVAGTIADTHHDLPMYDLHHDCGHRYLVARTAQAKRLSKAADCWCSTYRQRSEVLMKRFIAVLFSDDLVLTEDDIALLRMVTS